MQIRKLQENCNSMEAQLFDTHGPIWFLYLDCLRKPYKEPINILYQSKKRVYNNDKTNYTNYVLKETGAEKQASPIKERITKKRITKRVKCYGVVIISSMFSTEPKWNGCSR